MKTQNLENRENVDLEPFYKVLENDSKMLESAFEILLDMITSYPGTTKNLAFLIKDEYPALFKEIATICGSESGKSKGSSCCGGN